MTPRTGVVPGLSAFDRACTIAGCLAELGVQRIVLQEHGRELTVHARTTNLPALLLEVLDREGRAILRTDEPSATLTLTHESATWSTTWDALGDLLERGPRRT